MLFEVLNRTASAHFVGGIPIGECNESGAVDPYLRAFGQPGLHVMDGSVMPANPGVNPSLMITAFGGARDVALAEQGRHRRSPASGLLDTNASAPVMPYHPIVPMGAPAELRLDAKKSDVIPDYPY